MGLGNINIEWSWRRAEARIFVATYNNAKSVIEKLVDRKILTPNGVIYKLEYFG